MSMIYEHEIKLSSVAKRRVVDLYGYICNEFGDPTFKITRVAFHDGTTEDVDGEHDFPFVCLDIPEEFLEDEE